VIGVDADLPGGGPGGHRGGDSGAGAIHGERGGRHAAELHCARAGQVGSVDRDRGPFGTAGRLERADSGGGYGYRRGYTQKPDDERHEGQAGGKTEGKPTSLHSMSPDSGGHRTDRCPETLSLPGPAPQVLRELVGPQRVRDSPRAGLVPRTRRGLHTGAGRCPSRPRRSCRRNRGRRRARGRHPPRAGDRTQGPP